MLEDGVDSREIYERLGEGYARMIEQNAFNALYERPATLSLLPDVRGKRVLDAGCGPGAYSARLVELGAEVTACDISPRMLELAARRVPRGARFVEHDLAEPLAFAADRAFDVVISSLTLHYLADWEPTLREFHRVLAPGGCLVMSVHHPFWDITLSPSGAYFDTELLFDSWRLPDRRESVRFFRRPLGAIFDVVKRTDWRVDHLLEPLPTEECRHRFPADYQRLSRQPCFLCLRLTPR